ncbi:hypothetical protein DDM70_17625 [Vibrio cholerae]|nr:hypothetical protein [Vibrio cholerae]PAR55025.1 hypothetical protein CGT93_06700 [Vibrio metoecus]EGR4199814.1 hypothetical protein [Vibrio cholerae]EGR4329119.1 hypothetical protein [Vibrio cholerae]EGR4374182.1 hypothetical protein [Vibrio cholerae]
MQRETLVKYFFRKNHVESFFKWVEWMTLTVVICVAWSSSKCSLLIAPFALISVVYVWHSFLLGLSAFIGDYLAQFKLSRTVIKIVIGLLSPVFIFGPLFTLVPLFVAMLKL